MQPSGFLSGRRLGPRAAGESFNLCRPQFPRQCHLLLAGSPRVAMGIMSGERLRRACSTHLSAPLGTKRTARRKERLSSPRREGTHGPEPSSSHGCDVQVSSGHSRPPVSPAQLHVEPTERWLRKQTAPAPGGPSSGKAPVRWADRGAFLPTDELGAFHESPYHSF